MATTTPDDMREADGGAHGQTSRGGDRQMSTTLQSRLPKLVIDSFLINKFVRIQLIILNYC